MFVVYVYVSACIDTCINTREQHMHARAQRHRQRQEGRARPGPIGLSQASIA